MIRPVVAILIVVSCAVTAVQAGPARGYSSTQINQGRGTDDPSMFFYQPLPSTTFREQKAMTSKPEPAVKEVKVAPAKNKVSKPLNIHVTDKAKDSRKVKTAPTPLAKSAVAKPANQRTSYDQSLYNRVYRDPNFRHALGSHVNIRQPLPSGQKKRGFVRDWP